MDQPLYALAKQIQWDDANLDENNYVVMMGGLHIEMMLQKTIGDWLQGSGWTTALADAEILTIGRCDALTSASSVTRGRYAHQV